MYIFYIFRLWDNDFVGGVLALSMNDYRIVNGYSNLYWGWGGEDEDMAKRLKSQDYRVERPNHDNGK